MSFPPSKISGNEAPGYSFTTSSQVQGQSKENTPKTSFMGRFRSAIQGPPEVRAEKKRVQEELKKIANALWEIEQKELNPHFLSAPKAYMQREMGDYDAELQLLYRKCINKKIDLQQAAKD